MHLAAVWGHRSDRYQPHVAEWTTNCFDNWGHAITSPEFWPSLGGSQMSYAEVSAPLRTHLQPTTKESDRETISAFYSLFLGFFFLSREFVQAQLWRALALITYSDVMNRAHGSFLGSGWFKYDETSTCELLLVPCCTGIWKGQCSGLSLVCQIDLLVGNPHAADTCCLGQVKAQAARLPEWRRFPSRQSGSSMLLGKCSQHQCHSSSSRGGARRTMIGWPWGPHVPGGGQPTVPPAPEVALIWWGGWPWGPHGPGAGQQTVPPAVEVNWGGWPKWSGAPGGGQQEKMVTKAYANSATIGVAMSLSMKGWSWLFGTGSSGEFWDFLYR